MSQMIRQQTRTPLLQLAGAIFWGFFGVRKQRDHDGDIARITPAAVLTGGLVGAALFVTLLLFVVNVLVL